MVSRFSNKFSDRYENKEIQNIQKAILFKRQNGAWWEGGGGGCLRSFYF